MKKKTIQLLAIAFLATSILIPSLNASAVQITEEDIFDGTIDIEDVESHYVTYSWTGLPDNHGLRIPTDNNYYAPEDTVIMDTSFQKGRKVNIGSDEYVFEGWYVDGIPYSGNEFSMPDYNVTINGIWNKTKFYSVTYSWSGLPNDKIAVPVNNTKYREGDEVKVDINYIKNRKVTVDGIEYIFTGWKSKQVDVDDDYFTMPAKNVTFTGDWSSTSSTYRVSYQFNNLPDGAKVSLPESRDYYHDSEVTIDTYLREGSEITVNGETYVFSGWSCNGLYVQDGKFKMPSYNITLNGTWRNKNEKRTYNVTYSWTGLPEGNTVVIPENVKVKETETYTINPAYVHNSKVVVDNREFYFSGWSVWNNVATINNNQLVMPSSDVVLIGAWTEVPTVAPLTNTTDTTNTQTQDVARPNTQATVRPNSSVNNNTSSNTTNTTTSKPNTSATVRPSNNNTKPATNNTASNIEQPETGMTPVNAVPEKNNVGTSDNSQIMLFMGLFIMSIAGMIAVKKYRK